MRILWLALLPVIWFYFFFPPADLSFSPGRRTSQSVSIHFLWDLGGVAAFQCLPPSLRSRAEHWGGTGEGSVVLTSHEINLGAGKQLPTDFLSMSGLRFGICCASWAAEKAASPLLFIPAGAGMCVTMRIVVIWVVGLCQEGFSLWEMGWQLCFRARECLINFLASRQHLKWKSFWAQSVQSARFGVGAGLKGQGCILGLAWCFLHLFHPHLLCWSVTLSPSCRIAEKDKQIKQMEDSLGNERANLTSKEEELKV